MSINPLIVNLINISIAFLGIVLKNIFIWQDPYIVLLLWSIMIISLIINRIIIKYVKIDSINSIKFMGHLSLISLLVYYVINIISNAYSLLFYFGLFNTILVINTILFLLNSSIFTNLNEYLSSKLSSSSIGRFSLKIINIYYNILISLKKIGTNLAKKSKNMFMDIVIPNSKKLLDNIILASNDLGDNETSINIKTNFINNCENVKKRIIGQIFNYTMTSQMNNLFKVQNNLLMSPQFKFEPLHKKITCNIEEIDDEFSEEDDSQEKIKNI